MRVVEDENNGMEKGWENMKWILDRIERRDTLRNNGLTIVFSMIREGEEEKTIG